MASTDTTEMRETTTSLNPVRQDPTLSETSIISTSHLNSSDEDVPNGDTDVGVNGADSVVGISIGYAQDHMRSPTTPAVEKAQALDRSRNYFFPETHDVYTTTRRPPNDVPPKERADSQPHPPHPRIKSHDDDALPSAQSTQQTSKKKHSSIVGPMLAGATDSRKRSSSGSSMFDHFRKMLPDFPLTHHSHGPSHHGQSGERTQSESNDNYGLTTTESPENYSRATEDRTAARARLEDDQNSSTDLEVYATTSTRTDPITQRTLRRVTSDNSLYLHRTVTGASSFDDYSAFANVSDMVNSRFKAITDSFQDSSIKIPKLPSVLRPRSPRPNSDVIRENTRCNAEMSAEPMGTTRDLGSTDAHITDPAEKQHPLLTDALSQMEGDLVILGGYRGSILREAQYPNRQLWVPVKVGLNLRKADLEVGLTYEDELRMEEKIIPSGTLSHIGPIDISRRLLKKCRKCRNARRGFLKVHDWGYDWRLSPHLITEKLINFLKTLACNQPDKSPCNRGAWVIAHSLGGLVTRNAINKRPELFAGVLFAGTPQNCVNILGPLRNGDDVLLSSRVLTAQVNFTLRTSYALLPEDGRCFINKITGERYDVDFFDPQMWDEYRLSPCITPPLHRSVQPRKQSLIGSITESLSSYTTSLPHKRHSIFSATSNDSNNSGSTQTTSQSSSRMSQAKINAEDMASKAKHAAAAAVGNINDTNASLEPNFSYSHTQPKLSVATHVTLPRQEAQDYLTRILREVKQFKAELAHLPALQEANKYPPHAIVYSKAIPTVYGAKVVDREAIKYEDAFDDLAFAAGDGVVLASAAQLPPGYLCVKGGRVESDRGHVSLLGDLEGVGRCLGAIVEARGKGVGMGNFRS